ncbi:unnamed protein product, partial [Discosporangium mesarthrocarpum]
MSKAWECYVLNCNRCAFALQHGTRGRYITLKEHFLRACPNPSTPARSAWGSRRRRWRWREERKTPRRPRGRGIKQSIGHDQTNTWVARKRGCDSAHHCCRR